MKPSPFDHLPRRSLFAEAKPQRVNTNPVHVNINREHANDLPEPPVVTLASPKPVKLAAAVAALVEIGAPPVGPPPLVDTTQRGRGRPKVHADRAAYRREWMAQKRASKAS
jgi:hypothetical protein